MGFSTKLNLSCTKFEQIDGCALILSGDTKISAVGTICYTTDQSATYVARSLVDANYVTGKTSSAIICANNGLTKIGQNVVLGGNLTGNTNVPVLDSQTLLFGGNSTGINYHGGRVVIETHAITETCNNACISSRYNTCCSIINLIPTGITICSTFPTFGGACYAADYSPNFVDESLVTKKYVCSQTSGVTSNAICCADNGLTKIGNTVVLGGALTGNTIISKCGNSFEIGSNSTEFFMDATCIDIASNFSVIEFRESGATICALGNGLTISTGDTVYTSSPSSECTGIKYAGDYSTTYVARSLVDAQYVTGRTCCIACKADKNLATEGQIIYRDATQITGCCNMFYCDSLPSVTLGRGQSAIAVDSGIFAGACNTVSSECSVVIGGQGNFIDANTARAVIIGSQNITISGATYLDTTVVGCLAIKCTPDTCPGDVLTYQPLTGMITITTLASLGGLTGATNGLHACGQDARLGGFLIECTHIEGGQCLDIDAVQGFNVRVTGNTDMNIDAQQCGGFTIKSQCGSCDTFANFTDAVGFLGHITEPAGFAVYDNRTGTGQTGIVYAADYSLNYVNRSLVDKQYVNSVATGLNVHVAALVATTSGITIASAPAVIDGVTLTPGDRILVKNQGTGVTGATDNGIYDFNGAGNPLSRSTDYDGTPSGEVSNGDLIPVTSGDTQNNTLWAQTALNPITVGSTPLIFSLFATVIDVQGGQGIIVTQLGGVHTVCVELASNCGLTFCGNGLAVNPNIAGSGLTYTNGVLDVNAAGSGSISAIPVKFNAGCCLVVDCADINSALNAITGATNGLTKVGQDVILGGTLTGSTTICGNNDFDLSLTCLCNFNLGFGAGTSIATITDSNVTPKGLQYAADYSATFVDRSLVDVEYVTGKTSTSGVQTANNGLCKQGTNVKLGGTLTGNTTINQATFALKLNNGSVIASGTTQGFDSYNAYKLSGSTILSIPLGKFSCGNLALGYHALTGGTASSCYNTAIGQQALACITNGHQNTAVGYQALCSDKTGNCNVAIGSQALLKNTGTNNIAIGVNALTGGTASCNIAIGGSALIKNTTGNYNIAIGSCTLCANICGCRNIAIGSCTLCANICGNDNIAFGSAALFSNTLGLANIALGANTLRANTCGESNIAFGCGTLCCNTIGSFNIGIGDFVLGSNTCGICNIGIGSSALANNTTGCFNVGVGASSLTSNSTGCFNVGVGAGSLANSIITSENVAIGHNVLNFLSAGTNNTGIGSCVLANVTNACNNTVIGANSLTLNICGCNNVAIGTAILNQDLFSCANVAIGTCALNNSTTPYVDNIVTITDYSGTIAGTVLVTNNLGGVPTGNTNIKIISTLNYNGDYVATQVDDFSFYLTHIYMGDENTGIYFYLPLITPFKNTALGYSTLFSNISGNSNVAIGNCAGYNELGSNKLYIANTSTNHPLIYGEFDNCCAIIYGTFKISGATSLLVAPVAGSISDQVVVWNSSDKLLKTVAGSSLGDKNNIYAKQTITSTPKVLTTGCSYLQLVNVASAAVICLPASPIDGQAFKFKDISGNALSNNITLCAAVDDGSNALINTDYGALEVVWNNATSKWYSLAFIN